MLIDTHCHLDAPAFDKDREQVIARARALGVQAIVVPAIAPENFNAVRSLALANPGVGYALGIHPLFVPGQPDTALTVLRNALLQARHDPKLVAVGEIGLDFFVEGFDADKQEHFYSQQLQIAQEFELPVIIHVRKSADRLLKFLRQTPVIGGIAHAFNGSEQQANHFLSLGFALGFGGSLTYSRARRIRRHVTDLPASAHVLETDAPDIAPQWIQHGRNEPAELARIATQFASLRNESLETVLSQTAANAQRVLPGLQRVVSELA